MTNVSSTVWLMAVPLAKRKFFGFKQYVKKKAFVLERPQKSRNYYFPLAFIVFLSFDVNSLVQLQPKARGKLKIE